MQANDTWNNGLRAASREGASSVTSRSNGKPLLCGRRARDRHARQQSTNVGRPEKIGADRHVDEEADSGSSSGLVRPATGTPTAKSSWPL